MRIVALLVVMMAAVVPIACAADAEEERTHEEVAIEFFEGLDESEIFFTVTAESGAPESLLSPTSGPCEHHVQFGDAPDPRELLEAALTEEELAWVCDGCETAVYVVSASDVAYSSFGEVTIDAGRPIDCID
jgi:hypothetical protein